MTDCINLIPELCQINGFTYEMYYYGQFLHDAFTYIHDIILNMKKIHQWQENIAGFCIEDDLLLKQAIHFCLQSPLTMTLL
jgi:hypothetical protein